MFRIILGIVVFIVFVGCSTKLPTDAEITQKIPQEFANQSILEQISKQNRTQEILPPQEQIKILFEDEVFNELVEIAIKQNMDLQIAKARILQARSQLKSAWGELFPQVSANLSATDSHSRGNSSSLNGSSIVESSSQNTQIGATLSWEVDLFGRLNAAKNAQESFYYQSLEDLSNAQITLLGDLANLYFTLRETSLNIVLTKENILYYQDILELTRLKVENGLLDSTELFDAQDMLTDEQNTLEQLKTLQEETKNALLVLLDIKNLPFNLVGNYHFVIPNNFSLQTTPADVLLFRPDIKASIQSLYAQVYTKANAKASLFPILSLSADLSDVLGSSEGNAGNLAWSLAASLAAPILNRTQLTQNYFLQDAILQETYLTLQKNLNTALGEIENAIFNTKSTELQTQNNQQRLENAKSYYEFSANRRSIGLIDELEYLTNKASLNNSQKNLNTSKNSQLQAIIVLFKAFGGNFYLSKEAK